MLQATMRGVDLYGRLRGVDLYGRPVRGVDLYGGGLGAASTAVKDLQTALKEYAAAGHPEADPGAADGVVGPPTRNAVGVVVSQLPKIPEDIRTAIRVAVYAAAMDARLTAPLDSAITSYASQIAIAVRAALLVAGSGTPPASGGGRTTYQLDPGAMARIAAERLAAQQAEQSGGGAAAAFTSVFDIPIGKSWYQTWWGIGALAVGGGAALLGAYKLVV